MLYQWHTCSEESRSERQESRMADRLPSTVYTIACPVGGFRHRAGEKAHPGSLTL